MDPMPSFPLGSPAFPSQLLPSDNDVEVSPSLLAAARIADPSPSPSHFSASPTTFNAIAQALPSPPMEIDGQSPNGTAGDRTPVQTPSTALPTLQIPWSPTQAQLGSPSPPVRASTVPDEPRPRTGGLGLEGHDVF